MSGGPANVGAVFMLSPSAGGWQESVLYRFTGGADGKIPYAGVTMDSAGNPYGATTAGGASNAGVVYKLTPRSGSWSQTVLYSFQGRPDGAAPYATPTLDAAGNLYGATNAGGTSNKGTVYQLMPRSGVPWALRVLHNFGGGADGATPLVAGVIFDQSGNLYGATALGGSANCGVAYALLTSSLPLRAAAGARTGCILFWPSTRRMERTPPGSSSMQAAICSALLPAGAFTIREPFSR